VIRVERGNKRHILVRYPNSALKLYFCRTTRELKAGETFKKAEGKKLSKIDLSIFQESADGGLDGYKVLVSE
jgi:hypothetical protein